MRENHGSFWEEQPALLFALSVLIGSSSFLFWDFPYSLLWPVLWLFYLIWLQKWPLLLLVLGSALYSWAVHAPHPFAESPTQRGYFSIASLQNHQTPFQQGLLYKGTLWIEGQKVPCHISYLKQNPPKADCDYVLKGQLKPKENYVYAFKVKEWHPVENTKSLAEWRYRMKERFHEFLEEKLTRPKTASFLSSLLTGDVEDRMLRFQFGRLGLQHILAISGFHFAVLLAFCSFFLGLFLPDRMKTVLLIGAITAYFFFLGSSPAVQRSWLTATLYLFGPLLHRHSTGLNLLGVALLIEVLLDPLVCGHLGFQLSFLSCAGILLFRPLFQKPLERLLPYHRVGELSLFSRHIYLLASFFRECLSVNFAVNLAILPLLLYHFQKFPLLSLLYNLFFPLLVSGALFLLLVALLLHIFFAPLALPLFKLVDLFTAELLDLIAYPPVALDYSWVVPPFSAALIPLFLFALFCLALRQRSSALSRLLPREGRIQLGDSLT